MPFFVNAQIAASRPVAGTASTANGTSYAMTAFTPSANSLLVVFVFASGTVASAPTMTGGSLTWTREAILSSANTLAIFWAKVGANPVSTTITFDCTGDAATGADMSVIQFTGYDAIAANPIGQTKITTVGTVSTNANITFPAALNTSNGYGISWVGTFSTAPNSTPPTGWTEADDIAYATPSSSMATAYRAGGESTAGPFTFTNASTSWLAFGAEVKVASGTPVSPTTKFNLITKK